MAKDKKTAGPKEGKVKDITIESEPYEKKMSDNLLEINPNENIFSAFNFGEDGLTGNAEYAFDNGAVLGLDGAVPYDSQNFMDFENYDANLYGSMPVGNGDISAFIDKDRFWEAKFKQKIGQDAKLSAKINSENEWKAKLQQKLGDNFKANAYAQNDGGGAGLSYKKGDLSAFVDAARLDNQNQANFGVKYKF